MMMRSTTIRICTLVILSFALSAGAGLSIVESKPATTTAMAKVAGEFTQSLVE
ncbi:hypothetical protein [Paenibacillus guangzhouensis]|uniref:hypothetical protein n=1 Tax=Paenibacillus guangzhouensis TaxID=1473112 RepID=UPI00187B3FE9|nr:hypothetical protein [Paenibacillus guangzhouensis]